MKRCVGSDPPWGWGGPVPPPGSPRNPILWVVLEASSRRPGRSLALSAAHTPVWGMAEQLRTPGFYQQPPWATGVTSWCPSPPGDLHGFQEPCARSLGRGQPVCSCLVLGKSQFVTKVAEFGFSWRRRTNRVLMEFQLM